MLHDPEPLISLGAKICSTIKHIYFRQTEWVYCYRQIAVMLSHLKKEAKKFYSDKTEEEILEILTTYSHEDIKDGLHELQNQESGCKPTGNSG